MRASHPRTRLPGTQRIEEFQYEPGGVAPYMHIGNWIETIDDDVRIAKAVDRRDVGVMFHLHHWQAVGNRDYNKLRADPIKAKPYLMKVVIQSTDKDKATHKILGEGTGMRGSGVSPALWTGPLPSATSCCAAGSKSGLDRRFSRLR